MKFIIDETAPKQVLFFKSITKELERRNHKVYITTRRYKELNKLQDLLGVDARIIGEWAPDLVGKLKASTERINGLADFILSHDIDGAISLSSVEIPRAIFGFNRPLFIFNDIPVLNEVPLMQSRLTLPLATLVFAPFCVPTREFRLSGFNGRVIHFPCLDPIAWLKEYETDDNKWKKFIDKKSAGDNDKYIFLRESELKASYLEKHKDIVLKIARELKNQLSNTHLLIKRRYDIIEPPADLETIDDLDILTYVANSDLFVGGGGTMNIEASFFGVPTLYCRPKTATYEEWIIRQKLGFKTNSVREGVKLGVKILKDNQMKKKMKQRSRQVFKKQHFPVKKICKEIIRETEMWIK